MSQADSLNTLLHCPNKKVPYLELLFLTVLALPNASRTGFDCTQRQRNIEFVLEVNNT